MRGSVSHWPLWKLPRWLQALVVAVVALYCVAVCAAVAVTSVHPGQLRLFAVLLACSWATAELSRRTCALEEPGGVVRDVNAIWELPAAVLLPPVFALLAPLLVISFIQVRARRTMLHRRAYSAAVVGLASAAASTVFHAALPVLGPSAGLGSGGRAMLWTVLAATCGLLRLAVNDGLVLAAVKGSAPETNLLPEIAGAEALYGNVAELSLGTLSAFAAVHSMLAIVYALPLVVSLQRSLRHAQLVAETRVDGKTGLLNDKTWRQQAAGEVARAVRTRTPVAVGILDIDHFKKVNDNYGHLAGDAVLATVAAALTALLRDYDISGRVGGEEFGFILPNSPLLEAVEVAERLREKIPEMALQRDGPARLTVSIGLAVSSRPVGDLSGYYRLADQALYAAKQNGRDAVWVVQADQTTGPSGAVRAHAAQDQPGTCLWKRD